MAAKGGEAAGHRRLARRANHQAPRRHRCPRPPGGDPPHARQQQRREGAPDLVAAIPGRLRRLVADRGYDADALRRDLRAAGATPVIPGRRTRRRPIRHDQARYKDHWRIEAAFCRLKDFRRIATRYDKLAVNFASAVALASIVAFWC